MVNGSGGWSLLFLKNLGNSVKEITTKIRLGSHTKAVSSKHSVKSGNESEYQVRFQSFESNSELRT